MPEGCRESAKKWCVGRVVLVYVVVGVIFGCLSAVVRRMMSLPAGVATGVVCGAIVLIAPVLHWLVRADKARWLLRE
jgi:hypothetical protein